MPVVTKTTRIEIPDPVLGYWAGESLLWLAERGAGYLRTDGDPYGDEYFEKYVDYAKTPLGKRLTDLRIAFIERHISDIQGSSILDVGVGCGDFITRASEKWSTPVYGYDVSRRACEWLTDRTLFRDARTGGFRIATFFDSLEHIPGVHEIIANVTGWIFCSLPIVPGAGPPLASWKHLRHDEHCLYFTRDGFIRWMAAHGFVCTEHNTAESIAGREDIGSFAFRRAE